ncbi:unnamed protein product, partial [marine sediment metagenome]
TPRQVGARNDKKVGGDKPCPSRPDNNATTRLNGVDQDREVSDGPYYSR